ncbi:hypothetical protein T06_8405 [Trichinella sp. T6]|nr:hypothetical protein T06_8405 [Trichinella sp. T6]
MLHFSRPLGFAVVCSRGNHKFQSFLNTCRSCSFGSLLPYGPTQLRVNCMEYYETFTDLQANIQQFTIHIHIIVYNAILNNI